MGTALAACASLAVPSSAARYVPVATYTGAGTVVVKQAGAAPAADEGALVCVPNQARGVGGGCISFGTGINTGGVQVDDAENGRTVAFQVCIDNNGDGRCVSPDPTPCGDQIFFSHDDAGNFFNPLGPLPIRHRDGCPGGRWDGYIVFVCTGAHTVDGTAHNHGATTGTISAVPTGTGFGTFCGGTPAQPTNKPYVVVDA
jgi:hypothetical protein